ncbi:sphingomyelin phosphodiesterase-like [Artemia franciscana]|uniref:Saposin B-type domain-containing protein n=1 Tax=Artemia franciscana TaxID=6661 RepID=A0AA88IJ62_ARTSF|nr:hypothetical protein QYM36_008434 [Artemia franciscana]KAK2727957.1 hypothetical protein QYM36_008434 [Artemia franciscana]KAK2727958.1 hypothetical protein QYM36_008434 [Artemia franciscana]
MMKVRFKSIGDFAVFAIIVVSVTSTPLTPGANYKAPFYWQYGEKDYQHNSKLPSVDVPFRRPRSTSKSFEETKTILRPAMESAAKKLEDLDPKEFNFTAIMKEIDELPEPNDRAGRGSRGIPAFLGNAFKLMNIKAVMEELETSVMSSVSCNACKAGVGLLQHYVDAGKNHAEIISAAVKVCITMKIESKRVCEGIIHLMGDEVLYVMSRLVLTADEICGFVIGDVCGHPFNPYHEWEVILPPIPKPVTRAVVPVEDAPALKVLHLSDTHLDPYYVEGTNAACNEPLCCRITSGYSKSVVDGAGYWGDYRKCDMPRRTLESMFQHIATQHPDLDYIVWTGDIPPHDVWNQTRKENIHVLRETVQLFNFYFPNTRVFPALGNHESVPVNSFPPPFVESYQSVDWLYKELELQWRKWLPASASPTVLKGGFYSVLAKPGFRIISLNMNFCNNKNWWLLLNSTDPVQELQWLIYELQSAEFNGEKVHILGHIPPGHSDCLKVWSHNYYRIINRYEATVTAQFFGHTHFDEYEVFYDEDFRSRATNIAYIGPSVSPYYGLNPGYRVYKIDGDYKTSTRAVVDHENWVMNLAEANRYPHLPPRWYKLYSAKEAYGMTSLSPQEWDSLVYRMAMDDDLFQNYYWFYWKGSSARQLCDADCKKRLLCDLKSGRSNDRVETCNEIEQQLDSKNAKSWRSWLRKSGLGITYVFTFVAGLGWLGSSVGSLFG